MRSRQMRSRHAKGRLSFAWHGPLNGVDGPTFGDRVNSRAWTPRRKLCPSDVGDRFAGKYLVERVIGSGGMGVVVAALHE